MLMHLTFRLIEKCFVFFIKLRKWTQKYANNKQEIILVVDLNVTESNSLDRQNKECVKDVSTLAFNALLENENLHDMWREMHPNKKQFTYFDKSRLERFFISDECLNYTQNTHIFQAGIKTDH